jgi:hypothetical protein
MSPASKLYWLSLFILQAENQICKSVEVQMIESDNNWWLPKAFWAATQGLRLSLVMLHKMNYEQVLAHVGDARLSRLVEPLPLSRPSEVARQLEKAGGIQVLFSQAAQAAIASWGTIY